MANQQIDFIEPRTAAYTSPAFPTNMYNSIVVTADNLAGGETINVLVVAGITNLQVLLPDGSAATITATLQGFALEGGPSYVFVKSITAGLCGLYIDPQLK